ncbi:hypothetical protein F5J12DRAFT_511548 [Pisolithus orientalis]|uniref:uncharacterized protein n=1 Tax=Pisolithus orientalis TaxID=936130 RepID=UPI0022250B33|nr:uncharacterized protein F5J12DRAFT_511548 [Pisolithus orientalis]KAI6014970.1 hypothetical protein F5J12DRAFT_511548 [Pisolithus orientalis]
MTTTQVHLCIYPRSSCAALLCCLSQPHLWRSFYALWRCYPDSSRPLWRGSTTLVRTLFCYKLFFSMDVPPMTHLFLFLYVKLYFSSLIADFTCLVSCRSQGLSWPPARPLYLVTFRFLSWF